MTLEANLLKVIEEQQQQLRQQQIELNESLQALDRFGDLTERLERRIAISEEKHNKAVKIVNHYSEVIQRLQEQTLSEHFSEDLQSSLKEYLEKRLIGLVNFLQIKDQVHLEMQAQLPNLLGQEVESEIKKQIHSLVLDLQQKQLSLQSLIQQLSEKL